MLNLIRSQKDRLDITVITTRFDPSLPVREIIQKAVVLRVGYWFTIIRTKFSPAMVVKFWKELRGNDTVLINSPCSMILPVAFIGWITDRRVIIFHQGDLILPRGIFNRVIEGIFFICTYLSCMMADDVATYTRDYAEQSSVLKPFLYKFTPLLMPVYQDKPATPTWVADKLRELKKDNRVIFGFAGRFVEEKGFDILFDAVELIKDRAPRAYFVFAGDRKVPYERFFEHHESKLESIRERVLFLDLLTEQELYDFYAGIDAIITPSRSDCFNLVQAEAMMNGKPSIVADIAGARSIVRETGFGLVFKGQSPQHLAQAILDFIDNPNQFAPHQSKVMQWLDNERAASRITEFLAG